MIAITSSNVGDTKPPEFNEDTLRMIELDKLVGSPKTSKPYSPSEVPDSRILRGYCGVEGSGCLGPF